MNKHLTTLPDGTTATRNSKGRTYSHAIAVRTTEAELRDRAERNVANHLDSIARIEARLATGEGYEAPEGGFAHWSRVCDEHNLPIDVKNLAKAEAELAAITGDRWGVLSWASRPDLADKAADTARRQSWAEVRILPAEVA
jgi:hypothetical protein